MIDRDRTRAALGAARAMLPTQPDRSLPLFEQVARDAGALGDAGLEADAELGRGEAIYAGVGRERESLRHFWRAAQLAPGTNTAALASMAAGDVYAFLGEPDAAHTAYARAVDLFECLGDSVGATMAREGMAAVAADDRTRETPVAHSTPDAVPDASAAMAAMQRATVLLTAERGDAGLADFATAASLFKRVGESLWAARALLGQGHAMTVGGRHADSIECYAESGRLFDECRDSSGAVEAAAARLEALAVLERWDAGDLSRMVMAATAAATDPQARLHRLVALRYDVRAALVRDDLAAAGPLAAQAADLAAGLGDLDSAARMRVTVARSLARVGRHDGAVAAYEKVLAMLRGEPGFGEVDTVALAELAVLLHATPRLGAERLARLADGYAAAGDTRLEALARSRLARLLYDVPGSRVEQAAEYVRAANLYDAVEAQSDSAWCWYEAAIAYGRIAWSDDSHRDAGYAAAQRAADRFAGVADWRHAGLAEFLAARTLLSEAIGHGDATPRDPRILATLRRSLQLFDRADAGIDLAATAIVIAVELSRAAAGEVWMSVARTALDAYERGRAAMAAPHDRQQWDTIIPGRGIRILTGAVRRAAVDTDTVVVWADLVWALEQAAKARALQDAQLQTGTWDALTATDEVLASLQHAAEQLTVEREQLTRKIDDALLTRPTAAVEPDAERLSAAERDLAALQGRIRQRLARLQRERPDITGLASVPPASPTQLQACLAPGEAYVGFVWNDGAPLRTVVTAGSFTADAIDGVHAAQVRRITAAVRRGENPPAEDLTAITGLLDGVPPGTDTLLLSPDLLLTGVPWRHLPAGDGTVGDRHTVALVPSAGLLRQLRARAAGTQMSRAAAYLGVACDGRGSGDKRLRCVDGEVAGIANGYFPDDPKSRHLPTADCPEFLATGCDVRLLHLACHMQRSGLLLSHDGSWTTPVDLLQPGRRFGADILLLTGCNAGDFAETDDNEFLGIIRQLMLVTGARAAVASVAPVPDAAAPVFADLVVAALTARNPGRPWPVPASPMPVGAAVGWAATALRGLSDADVEPVVTDRTAFLRPSDPSWWSPWLVIGDPRTTFTA
jgi:tetratricopeptide (TPR) repeat protein